MLERTILEGTLAEKLYRETTEKRRIAIVSNREASARKRGTIRAILEATDSIEPLVA